MIIRIAKLQAAGWFVAPLLLLGLGQIASAQGKSELEEYIRNNYARQDHQIPMRDGVKLYTVVYSPKNQDQKYPILMSRTPYSVKPYDKGTMRTSLGPNKLFVAEGYIFVYQDVRGRYMSEGMFVNMRPHQVKHTTKNDIDESTDTFDTIDWLVKNVPNNNGKVGIYGISYPGYYTSAGMIDAHPALKAASPQAPIADWFFDDFFHHGAFFVTHAFNFFSSFGQERPAPTTKGGQGLKHWTNDGYQFFLDLGPLSNANTKYYKNKIAFWNEMTEHPNYDAFWQARNLLPHLKNCAPAVMTVGGWFDAEDLYGALNTYQAVEKNNKNFNVIVMGPWAHGAWSGPKGDKLGNISFGSATSDFYQRELELPFFNHFLKDKGEHKLPEAMMFETGANQWRKFDVWPPKEVASKKLYFQPGYKLDMKAPTATDLPYAKFISDPHTPVPYTEAITTGMSRDYMTDDQRFASKRPDVLTFQTEVLDEDLTIAGPMLANLVVATSGTDADWIVKVIDVFPHDDKGVGAVVVPKPLAGYQMMVRSEVIRGRFRNSYEKPEPFKANEPTSVRLPLQDVLHTFKKGHRVMVQVCCTWFPLVDRNPQKYVDNIFQAKQEDFTVAEQRLYWTETPMGPSSLEIGVLKASKQ
ncbi:MAG TPA: CocE/NonD family hydrolase [Gemmataceae bacterium]|nr:CocE/NonD family hydrolase [Gemmataceae bacterium]